MQSETFTMLNTQAMNIFVYQWLPDPDTDIKAVLQIAHGMCETGARYEELASLLTEHGYAVYVHDHRGHGRTAENLDTLGDPGENGFEGMIEDLVLLSTVIKERHPQLPHYLLGHSMGSFITQKIMCTHSHHFDGFLLSGSNGPRALLSVGENLAAAQVRIKGAAHRSVLINAIVFGPYNKGFGPVRTPFDWLSSDPEEVDLYVNDPYCGQVCSARFFQEFFGLLRQIHKPALLSNLVKDKPIYIFSGDEDPVGLRGKGVRNLIELYQKLGVEQLEYRLYPGGRHEMLHEVNRDEVATHVLDWLERHVPDLDKEAPTAEPVL
ncbi:Lysophospholipase, alpha-beta hydrolase superfamily [Paenibacillus uliginis N3/975]|uniref:Lysophospholipase, alpha-beta hydrolase superfamily n=1 Tax=Paenibacillus uliginis N3/975 TaxID=1313296 RepID=A0A1X7GTU8_9BACL|nr:alpha/beta hydrolase [Paenibacillus uliginis]SMF74616.1 Lysophospholipase, alpha-beta hydrolase superfamily [Paenibacillus uliginis N3/975]